MVDGIHDLGGMHGFGAIEREADEPVFHAPWEGRVFAIDLVVEGFIEGANIDAFRHSIERLDPVTYLTVSYYEKWLAAIETLLAEGGALGKAEIDERVRSLAGEDPTGESPTGESP